MRRNWQKGLVKAALGLTLAFSLTPAAHAESYTAKENDTFFKISQQYNVKLHDLLAANADIDPLNIYSGISITIPDQNEAAKESKQFVIEPSNAPVVIPQSKLKASSVQPKHKLKTSPVTNAKRQVAAVNKLTVVHKGQQLNYSRQITATASAYTAHPSENGWGPIDYFGNPLKVGTIAVDPKVIPLGSKVYITGYSFDGLPVKGMIATATDTGSAIKGNRVDIFVPTSQDKARDFGFQSVKIYVLK